MDANPPCSCNSGRRRRQHTSIRRRQSNQGSSQHPRPRRCVPVFPLLAVVHLVVACLTCLPPRTSAGRLLLDRPFIHRKLSEGGGPVHLLIGYKNERGKLAIQNHTVSYDNDDDNDSDAQLQESHNTRRRKSKPKSKAPPKDKKGRHGHLQDRVPVVAAMIDSVEQLDALESDPDIDYVEEDSLVKLLSSEVIPLGMSDIQATLLFSNSSGGGGDCTDPKVFRIGIVDSGSDSSHPDLPCYDPASGGSGVSSRCVGETFGLDATMTWNAPADSHGTMVTGIIGATRSNGAGVVGAADGRLFCFVVARVFASMAANALMSDVLEGMAWAVDQGVKVINLSLGGPDNSTTAKLTYDKLQSQGVLVVAAAGNDGTNEYSYPASYASVLSVGAIDASTNEKASFSNYNAEVDVAAPGVQVLSTGVPSSTSVVFLSPSDSGVSDAVTGKWWQSSGSITSQSGILIDCGTGIDAPCDTSAAGGGASICLLQRSSEDYFSTMIDNCQSAGGISAIIVNNVPGLLDVTLNGGTTISIPAIGVTPEDGATLKNELGQTISLSESNRYAYADGTSFASPHAAGAAAAIWQMCPACTNLQVRSCLESTALDLGATGRDDMTGSGLIQMSDAYSCLADTEQCCHSAPPTAPSPVPADASPYPTMVSTEPPCATQELAYSSCFSSELSDSGAACAGCLNSFLSDLTGECASVSASICSSLTSCGCDPCQDSLEAYYACLLPTLNPDTSCSLACPDSAAPSIRPVSAPPTALPDSATPPSSPAPATSPPTSASPTFADANSAPVSGPTTSCDALLVTAQSCLSDQFNSTGEAQCQDCVNSAVPNGVVACADAEADICTAFDTCVCGTCRALILEYFTCSYGQLGCSIGCTASSAAPTTAAPLTSAPTPSAMSNSGVPTSSPSSTGSTPQPSFASASASSSPTTAEICLDEAYTYETCFNATLADAERESCRTCVDSALGTLSVLTSCSDTTNASICEALALCPCGACSTPVESFVSCISAASTLGCPIDCPNATVGSACQNEQDAYSTCLFSDQLSSDESSSCHDCVSTSKASVLAQSTALCSGVQAQACGTFEKTCSGCGSCSIVAKDYLLCQLNDGSSESCTIECSTSSDATPVPELEPTPSTDSQSSGNENEFPSTPSSSMPRTPELATLASSLWLWLCLT